MKKKKEEVETGKDFSFPTKPKSGTKSEVGLIKQKVCRQVIFVSIFVLFSLYSNMHLTSHTIFLHTILW